MSYTNPNSNIGRPIDANFLKNNTAVTVPIKSATLGLVSWNPESMGCRKYDPSTTNFSPMFQFARVMGVLAPLLGLVAIINISIEVICCRCCCSRCTVTSLFVLMIISQCLTFTLYATNVCISKSNPYGCRYENGSTFAIVAVISSLICSTLSCVAPKGRPLIRSLMEIDRRNDNDPCCYCCRKNTINIPPKSSRRPQFENVEELVDENSNQNDRMNNNKNNNNADVVNGNHIDGRYDNETERSNMIGQQITISSVLATPPNDEIYYTAEQLQEPLDNNSRVPFVSQSNTAMQQQKSSPRYRQYDIEEGNTFFRLSKKSIANTQSVKRSSRTYCKLLWSLMLRFLFIYFYK
jgi:hypothetical protein